MRIRHGYDSNTYYSEALRSYGAKFRLRSRADGSQDFGKALGIHPFVRLGSLVVQKTPEPQ
jgi:hypothetical protein